jgi:hypothetical protein
MLSVKINNNLVKLCRNLNGVIEIIHKYGEGQTGCFKLSISFYKLCYLFGMLGMVLCFAIQKVVVCHMIIGAVYLDCSSAVFFKGKGVP